MQGRRRGRRPGLPVRTPPVETLCKPCGDDSDCHEVGAKCLDFPDGRFCGRGCLGDPTACPEGYACSEITNDLGQVTSYQCTPAGGSCVCPADTHYDSDPANCGFCGHACSYAFAAASCADSSCVMGACEDGHQDLDHEPQDGCEYACTVQVRDDEPEPDEPGNGCYAAGVVGHPCDQNCDGIDGDWTRAVFVAPNGLPNASGAAYDPLPSIQAGIDMATADSRDALDQVYVAAGSYTETVTLSAGALVFGGFSNDGKWQRDIAANPTIVQSSSGTTSIRVVVADGITSARTVFDSFTVLAGTNSRPGGSSCAIWVRELRTSSSCGTSSPSPATAAGVAGQDGAEIEQPRPATRARAPRTAATRAQGSAGGDNQCVRGGNARGGDGGAAGCDSFLGSRTRARTTARRPAERAAAPAQATATTAATPDRAATERAAASCAGGAGEVVAGFWRGLSGADGGGLAPTAWAAAVARAGAAASTSPPAAGAEAALAAARAAAAGRTAPAARPAAARSACSWRSTPAPTLVEASSATSQAAPAARRRGRRARHRTDRAARRATRTTAAIAAATAAMAATAGAAGTAAAARAGRPSGCSRAAQATRAAAT
ncbi:MAG: hypothetical protein U1F43_37745 [Myxococcota bacterium]